MREFVMFIIVLLVLLEIVGCLDRGCAVQRAQKEMPIEDYCSIYRSDRSLRDYDIGVAAILLPPGVFILKNGEQPKFGIDGGPHPVGGHADDAESGCG